MSTSELETVIGIGGSGTSEWLQATQNVQFVNQPSVFEPGTFIGDDESAATAFASAIRPAYRRALEASASSDFD
jgi:hypothetical protein